MYSQAVTHPSTNTTQCCLTSVIGRELVLSTWYGRRHWDLWKIDYVLKNIQVELSQTVWAGFLLTWNTLHKSHLVSTFANTSYTPKHRCRGSGFQSPKQPYSNCGGQILTGTTMRRRWYNGQHSCLPSSWSGFDSRPTQFLVFTHVVDELDLKKFRYRELNPGHLGESQVS